MQSTPPGYFPVVPGRARRFRAPPGLFIGRGAAAGWGACIVAACVALLLTLPSLGAGLQIEDHWHRALVQATQAPVNLFGNPSAGIWDVYHAKDRGDLPWLASEDFNIALLRPLSSLTHYVDYRFWPDDSARMHAHSMVYFLALVIAVGALFARLCGSRRAAAVATLLYALDDAHGTALGWLANRNALIATGLGALALCLHHDARTKRSVAAAIASALCFALALAAGEMAVGVVGYFFSYACFMDRSSGRDRVRSLVPCVAVLSAWGAYYVLGGYGATGSGAYIDPAGSPLQFAWAASRRLPLLLFGATSGLPVEAVVFGIPAKAATGVVLAWLALFAAVLAPWLRASRAARFWAAGAVIAAVFACATYAADRLLFVAGIGTAALVGTALGEWRRVVRSTFALPRGVALGLLAVTHGLLSPLALPLRSRGLKDVSSWVEHTASATPALEARAEQDLVVVRAPDAYLGLLVLSAGRGSGTVASRHIRTLYSGLGRLRVSRPDARTLVLEAPEGFLSDPGARIYRSPTRTFSARDGLQLTRLLIRVRRVDAEGAPTRVSFHFAEPLESDRFVWAAWHPEGYRAFSVPEVGESVEL